MRTAIRIEKLGKRYRLGETHETTLSGQIVRTAGRLLGRNPSSETRRPEDFWALRDVDLEIGEGEAVGIIGGNGAGKSTLLKILSRITQPTTGRALVRGRLSSLLEVGTGFHPELTGRENVFLNGTILGMRKHEVIRKFDEIVAFAGVEKFVDTPVKRYSSGMYVRLAFAVAAHLEPDVLIVDEVLAVGDVEFQQRCLGKMDEAAKQGRTVLFVSHNMAAIQKLCTRAVWMRGGMVASIGAAEEVVGEYVEAYSGRNDPHFQRTPGFAYHADAQEISSGARVTYLQLLDDAGKPSERTSTWSKLNCRIGFEVAESYRSFCVVVQVSTIDGVPLILTSTTPDRDQAFGVSPGAYCIDCSFDQFPLAAGEYLLGLGLAIPGVEYVWRNDAVCTLHVMPQDIFGSGLPPSSRRYLVATPHAWQPLVRLGVSGSAPSTGGGRGE